MDRITYPTGYSWSYGCSFDDDTEALFVLLFNIAIAFFHITDGIELHPATLRV
jgi:hydrophobic/amphiphilic exporter-1 (mainly G- bacteria), HAE1 family